ncbi:MAG: hypothetical protein IPH13_16895 [Planctomycetes bacterium]|nr:hypothetical protein [Planctomycetota bacterium]MCC7173200.1 hypothetical protein [Planctomycetota bacterium]
MVRAWILGVVVAASVWGRGGVAAAAMQNAPEAPVSSASARDAYLEGWFQETAQRDLQAALTAYRACVAKGDDRELAAKAMVRMAWIARALGDDDAAKAQFAQVVEQYGDTKAAGYARAELEAPVVDPAASGAAAVVLEARKALEEMFANGEGVTPGKVEQVFAVLGAQDFAEVRKASGREGEAVLRTLFRVGRVDLLVAIAEVGVVEPVMRLAGTLGSVPEFEGKLDRFATAEGVDALDFVQFALGQSATSTHAIAAGFVMEPNRVPEWRWVQGINTGTFFPCVYRAGRASQAEPTPVFDALIDLVRAQSGGLRDLQIRDLEAPFTRRAIARYGEFPARQRASFLGSYNDSSVSIGAMDRTLFDAMLNDIDPAVRRKAIQRMAQDVDATIAGEGIRRAFAESPIDVSVIERELGNRARPIPTEVFLEAPAGAARERMYFALFSARDVQAVLALGLLRGDIEVVTAFFDPSAFVRNPALMVSGQLLSGDHAPSRRQEVRSALVAASDTQLLDRLAEAAAKHERLRVRIAAVELFAALARERDAAAQLMRFAVDPSPAVRIHVASQAARLPPEARRELAFDSSSDVGVAALMQIDDPATIEFLAQIAAADRADKVFELAQALDVRGALFAILEREDVSEELVQRVFKVLEAREPTAIARALVVGQRAGRDQLGIDARNALAQLAHLEPIKTQFDRIMQSTGRDAEDRAIADLAKIAREIEIAWREVKSAALLRELAANQQGLDARAFGRRLAAVTTREQLRMMLDTQGREPTSSVVAWALAEHGAKDLLVLQLTSPFASEDLHWLVEPLIAVSGAEDAIRAAAEGRLDPDRVWQALVTAREFVAAGRMRYGPGASYLSAGSNVATDTAIATALEEAGDVDTLLRAVAISGSEPAVRALLRLNKQELVFEKLPTWPAKRANAVTQQLLELTRVGPAVVNGWPSFADEQRALIEKFRAALANP